MLNGPHVGGLQTFRAGLYAEFNGLPFFKVTETFALDRSVMDE
jgi:hypothetical protein